MLTTLQTTFNNQWCLESLQTFNDDNNVVVLFNIVIPETFNDDNNVVVFDNVVKPDTFNDDNNVVLFNVVH